MAFVMNENENANGHCKFWQNKGSCLHGDECDFVHDSLQQAINLPRIEHNAEVKQLKKQWYALIEAGEDPADTMTWVALDRMESE